MHGHDHNQDHDFSTPEMAAHIELEGEVLSGLVTEALEVLDAACRRQSLKVGRVVDLGSGPGVGACLLAERFPQATVVAVDGSAAMLERAADRARRLGLGGRVETRQVDLAEGLPSVGPSDVAWVSMSLHHLGDEAAALGTVRALLEPGGLLALVERADPVHVGGVEVEGRPGVWERLEDAWARWFEDMRAGLPGATASATYPEMLAAAGFEVVDDRRLELDLAAPLGPDARRFLRHHVEGSLHRLAAYAAADDLAAVAPFAGAADGRWDEASISASRLLYVARPGGRAS
ncbi:MAG TPA: class I SAM-dependent methyltransferase [Acidimicrobiales bacterium]|nr:class I SAM-dependent methyltransferase [Acidimicrobiales bacterium]